MGATAALGMIATRAKVQHILRDIRLYARVGPRSAILADPSGLGRPVYFTTVPHVWFQGGQFLLTFYKGVI